MQKNRSKQSAKRTTRATTSKQAAVKQSTYGSRLTSHVASPISESRNFKSTTSFVTSRQTASTTRKISTSAVSTRRSFGNTRATSEPVLFDAVQKRAPLSTPEAKLTTRIPQHTSTKIRNFEVAQQSVPQPKVNKLPSRSFSSKFEDVADNGVADGPGGIKRPISPSIQIWKFTPAAYAHVGVRIAGVVLTGGFTLAGLTAVFGTCDIPFLFDQVKIHAPILVPILKASIVAPTVYHTLGGFRQLYQDFTAKGYSFKFQEQSSIGIAVLTLLSTLYFGAI